MSIMTITERLKEYEPLWENWYYDGYISSGSSGAVYRFVQDRFGKNVYSAVKVITVKSNNELTMHNRSKFVSDIRRRAEEEIENMYLLKNCPNVVHCNNHAIKDVIDESGEVIAVDILIQMDLYTCLVDYLADDGCLNEKEVIKLAEDVGTALKYAHDLGIIHRDIKPSNIFIDQNGEYLLGDLGVSKRLGTDSYTTRTGTEPYIAPEIWKSDGSDTYTTVADIYSLGIVLYMLMNDNYLPLVNENSSLTETTRAIADRIMGKKFDAPRNGNDLFKAVIMKACAYDVKDRYNDVTALIADLKTINSLFLNSNRTWKLSDDGIMTVNSFSDTSYKNFKDCVNSLVISDGVTEIPENAFRDFRLTEVFLPFSLKKISRSAFEMCRSLKYIHFEKCRKLKIIEKRAFSMCFSLENADLSNCQSLSFINDRAFGFCKNLKDITISRKSEIVISSTAFKNCRNINPTNYKL